MVIFVRKAGYVLRETVTDIVGVTDSTLRLTTNPNRKNKRRTL